LIFIEPTGDQQADANTKRNSSSSDQHDFWDRNRSLRQGHIPLDWQE
jgi:hypothetical protein